MTHDKQYIRKLMQKPKSRRVVAYADFETFSVDSGQSYVFASGLFCVGRYYEAYISCEKLRVGLPENDIKTLSDCVLAAFLAECKSLSQRFPLTVYFHNLSMFDGYFLLNFLISHKFDFKVVVKHTQIISLRVGRVYFLDSLLILSESLNILAQRFLGKSKIAIDPVFTIERIRREKALICRYLECDVLLLRDVFTLFADMVWAEYCVDVGVCPTVASLAFTVFRTRFYNDRVVEKPNLNLYSYIKRSYFGGINDVFIPYGSKLYVYDVNSLYPSCMQMRLMPVRFRGWKTANELRRLKEDFRGFFGFACVHVFVPLDFHVGPLPVRRDGKVVYPVGEITGTFFSEEIKFALRVGCTILSIFNAAEYFGEVLFSEFVQHFYAKKRSSSGVHAHLYKLLLNSLYGRFGLAYEFQNCIWVNERDYALYVLATSDVRVLAEDSGKYLIRYTYRVDRLVEQTLLNAKDQISGVEKLLYRHNYRLLRMNSSVAISSAIASYGRVTMLTHVFNLAPNCKLYYMDTDSMVVDRPLPSSLCGAEIGKFKLEFGECEGVFLAPKVYALRQGGAVVKLAFKGLSSAEVALLDWDWFWLRYCQSGRGGLVTTFFRVCRRITRVFGLFEIYTNQPVFYASDLVFDKRTKVCVLGQWVATRPLVVR